jgi:hypothetical protein
MDKPSISINVTPPCKGITAQFFKDIPKKKYGERTKMYPFTLFGTIFSFYINFKPSVNGCNNP